MRRRIWSWRTPLLGAAIDDVLISLLEYCSLCDFRATLPAHPLLTYHLGEAHAKLMDCLIASIGADFPGSCKDDASTEWVTFTGIPATQGQPQSCVILTVEFMRNQLFH